MALQLLGRVVRANEVLHSDARLAPATPRAPKAFSRWRFDPTRLAYGATQPEQFSGSTT
jgi:hypothetical protein